MFTTDQARDAAREHLRTMRLGGDPRAISKQTKAAGVTLQQVADAYVDRPGKLKESSKSEITRHVATTFAAWKDKPVTGISEEDVRKRYREMLTKGCAGSNPFERVRSQGCEGNLVCRKAVREGGFVSIRGAAFARRLSCCKRHH